jgi:hypothetical protein
MASYEPLHTLLLQKHKEKVEKKGNGAGAPKARIDNILGHPMMLAATSTYVVRQNFMQ